MNFLIADGEKFAHPLHHLGKSKDDLPLIAIDSFRHMYLFPKYEDMHVPGKLKTVRYNFSCKFCDIPFYFPKHALISSFYCYIKINFCFSFYKICIQADYIENFIMDRMKQKKIQAVTQLRRKLR